MATIEPRLIHLLNYNNGAPSSSLFHHADLPPLHSLLPSSSSERPLPPIEVDGAYRTDRPNGASQYPPRTAFDREAAEPSSSRSRIFPDLKDASDDAFTNKRDRKPHGNVQLPQPMKRQRSTQHAPSMPPIINGLLEPPPDAALFPPMASNSSYDTEISNIRYLSEIAYAAMDERRPASPLRPATSPRPTSPPRPASPSSDKSPARSRKRASKPRRRWSDQETKHLLLGVNRHGVGKWTSILEDPEFKFDRRTAGDLKDRFRTCCPEELRGLGKPSPGASSQEMGRRATKTGIYSENILIEDSPSPRFDFDAIYKQNDAMSTQKKSRAHRKKLEDLAELGIHGPFKKSHRRERRPFTERDDREILEGLAIYGPAWTKIQRDTRFHLSNRQPTDLRDRVRNKYPGNYQSIEKATLHPNGGARGGKVLEPAVDMSIDSSLTRPKQSSKQSSKAPALSDRHTPRDDPSAWPLHVSEPSSYASPSQSFEFTEPSGAHFISGEMDISRLLLDDSRASHQFSRYGTGSSPCSSSPPRFMSETRRDHHGQSSTK